MIIQHKRSLKETDRAPRKSRKRHRGLDRSAQAVPDSPLRANLWNHFKSVGPIQVCLSKLPMKGTPHRPRNLVLVSSLLCGGGALLVRAEMTGSRARVADKSGVFYPVIPNRLGHVVGACREGTMCVGIKLQTQLRRAF